LKGLMENSPAAHALHEAATVVAENLPAGQMIQAVAFVAGEY
jgi:hypothetical protein